MNIDYNLIVNYLWENITFEMFLEFIVLYFFIIWVALIVWVVKDISNRTQSIVFQLISVLIILLLSPLWIVVYLIIRPSKTLLERYYEEIDENLDMVEEVIEDKNCKEEESLHCFKCDYPISHDFTFCPNCNVKLKIECKSCWKTINSSWKNCPYCWEENNISKENKNYKKNKKEDKVNIDIKKVEKEVKDIIINEQEEFEKQKNKKSF